MAKSPACKEKASALAARLMLPFYDAAAPTDVVLVVDESHCFLRRNEKPVIDWHIDFLSPSYQNKFAQRGRKKDPLAKAIGLHQKTDLKVLDMTAGLGKDALWLAHCGATVTLVERHPVLAHLLEEAIQALAQDPHWQASAKRMHVINACAENVLQNTQPETYDVAYYDPMFEPRKKSALVKKDMQILQALHGDEMPDPGVIVIAQTKVPKVVVKRGQNDKFLCEGWHHQRYTQTTRFYVYIK